VVDWKKEIKLGGGKKNADEPAAPDAETVTGDDAPTVLDLVQAYLPEPAAVASDEAVPAPVAVPQPQPAPTAELVLLDELPTAEVQAEATPEAVPAPEPELQPVVVHPPVPAAHLPPLPVERSASEPETETPERVPFYKRELSLGRRKQAPSSPKPKRERRAKKARAPKAERPEQAPKPRRERKSLTLPRPQARESRRGGKRLVGLKVGASQIAAATVSNNGHAEVLQVARTQLPAGIVAAGELREPDLLAAELKQFFQQHKLPKRGVRLGIATNRIGVRTLEIAGIADAKQLANAIKFRAQEALPIPIDEAVLDFQVLGETVNEEGDPVRRILLVLAYRDLIDRYVSACRKAGIQLVGIDLEAFALLRALAAPRDEGTDAQAALVAVTIGHERTTFAVSDGRVCEFTRVLDWGGHALNVALARVLNASPSEMEQVKRELSLDGAEVPQGLTPQQAEIARDALRKQVQTFARELVSSLQFYQNQPGSLGIGEIVVTGGTAHLGGLAAELGKLIGVRVRVGDPLVRVKLGKKVEEPEQLGSLAVAIGLGIED